MERLRTHKKDLKKGQQFSPQVQRRKRDPLRMILSLLYVVIKSTLIEFCWFCVRACAKEKVSNSKMYSRNRKM